MIKNKDTITLTTEECKEILLSVSNKCVLTNQELTEDNLDNELKNLFLAREVALYIRSKMLLEENSFHLVKFVNENTILNISVGYVKISHIDSPQLTYGIMYS